MKSVFPLTEMKHAKRERSRSIGGNSDLNAQHVLVDTQTDSYHQEVIVVNMPGPIIKPPRVSRAWRISRFKVGTSFDCPNTLYDCPNFDRGKDEIRVREGKPRGNSM